MIDPATSVPGTTFDTIAIDLAPALSRLVRLVHAVQAQAVEVIGCDLDCFDDSLWSDARACHAIVYASYPRELEFVFVNDEGVHDRMDGFAGHGIEDGPTTSCVKCAFVVEERAETAWLAHVRMTAIMNDGFDGIVELSGDDRSKATFCCVETVYEYRISKIRATKVKAYLRMTLCGQCMSS